MTFKSELALDEHYFTKLLYLQYNAGVHSKICQATDTYKFVIEILFQS